MSRIIPFPTHTLSTNILPYFTTFLPPVLQAPLHLRPSQGFLNRLETPFWGYTVIRTVPPTPRFEEAMRRIRKSLLRRFSEEGTEEEVRRWEKGVGGLEGGVVEEVKRRLRFVVWEAGGGVETVRRKLEEVEKEDVPDGVKREWAVWVDEDVCESVIEPREGKDGWVKAVGKEKPWIRVDLEVLGEFAEEEYWGGMGEIGDEYEREPKVYDCKSICGEGARELDNGDDENK